MGRKLQDNLPMIQENIRPGWSFLRKFHEMDANFKQKQKKTMTSVIEFIHSHLFPTILRFGSHQEIVQEISQLRGGLLEQKIHHDHTV